MRRTRQRDRENVHKPYRLQAAIYNLAILMRALLGTRIPKRGADAKIRFCSPIKTAGMITFSVSVPIPAAPDMEFAVLIVAVTPKPH
jgi:hypothetical protein